MNTRLILDEASVAEFEGVSFHLNQATKHPENPVLLPGEPHQWDSLQVSWPATVLYCSDGKFRCWYSGFDIIQSPDRVWRPGYAESDDGVHWTKPNLGQATFPDKPTNRIAPEWPHHFMSCAFENPLPDAPPSQRFGSYWCEVNADGLWSKCLAWSPDGKVWERHTTAYSERKRMALQDISQLLYDADEPDPALRIKGYTQLFLPGSDRAGEGPQGWLRNIGLVCGESFEKVEDAPQPLVLAPEPGIDEELHFASVSKVDSTYLMLFESDRFSKNPIDGDLRLAVSDDGRDFRRIHPSDALVATGPKGMWDENLLVTTTASMQTVGDEVYIFYIGCPNIYNSWPAQYVVASERRGSMFAPCCLGLAILPRDRYSYAMGPGQLVTHPMELPEGELWINADGEGITLTARGGGATVTGSLKAKRLRGVYRAVEWSSAPPPGPLQLQFDLPEGGRLYSYYYA